MTTTSHYPKRLIEVDLPIRRISAHSRREKSIRHGHISTLHIWWARRPLAACRAVICAALWPDPADPLCPDVFRAFAREQMRLWANTNRHLASKESMPRIELARENPTYLDDAEHVRLALLDYIADFANWDNSTKPQYLETSRALTQAAHEALGGEPGTRPLVVDPFAGGGAIPVEALRVGADAFASDLNPVAVLLNKVVLEYIPRYGKRLADEVRKWGKWIQEQAEKELAEFYPKDSDGATPIAYLWARTICCEGPGCGTEVPLIRTLWLAKRSKNAVALRLVPNPAGKRVDIEIIHDAKAKDVGEGTVRKGAANCPVCGYTTANTSVRIQLSEHYGGASNAMLLAVVSTSPKDGRIYRLPTLADLAACEAAKAALTLRMEDSHGQPSPLPDELIPPERPSPNARGLSAVTRMGAMSFAHLFAPRPSLTLLTLCRLVRELNARLDSKFQDKDFSRAIVTSLALAVDKQADFLSSLVTWASGGEFARTTFARQALSIAWDFAECNPLAAASGSWDGVVEWVTDVISSVRLANFSEGQASLISATNHPLPNQSVQCWFTDPPYYDAVPYADLSEFFYVWLRRTILSEYPDLLSQIHMSKDEEAIWNPSRIYPATGLPKDEAFYSRQMSLSFSQGHRIIESNGIAVVVFAHKSTAGWEAILSALVSAGWVATASWPIDTERTTRTNAIGTASLASSIHIVCRPLDDSARGNIGDWREVLAELPTRIHAWMPRLVAEGIVGADAIFACLGPAVEIFSRYERVEKASGEIVTLRDYLPHVWAAVSREALLSILEGDETSELEDDARLTAIWFWVLKAAPDTVGLPEATEDDELIVDESEDENQSSKRAHAKASGYAMEYDAARKLAQGLGVDLSKLSRPGGIISIRGNVATLHQTASRERFLFGAQMTLFEGETPVQGRRSRIGRQPSAAMRMRQVHTRQPSLFAEERTPPTNPDQPQLLLFEETADQRPFLRRLIESGETILDRLHQSMLLFGGGQTALLGQFLTEIGMGTNPNFWRLAQALSALYPLGSDEKRWVDGVLARKKGWGM